MAAPSRITDHVRKFKSSQTGFMNLMMSSLLSNGLHQFSTQQNGARDHSSSFKDPNLQNNGAKFSLLFRLVKRIPADCLESLTLQQSLVLKGGKVDSSELI
ncbi:hypothetical protein AMECASPLE_022392 [Ameca splendens]|uniref:Uncharacterized protein n=1 Tax=Ameca splendens TaxID=208324 RepID=A0ABV0ZZD2_9TELE